MSNEYFKLTSVSTKPEKEGYYTLCIPSGETLYSYFLEGDWYEDEHEARVNEHHDTLDVDGCSWLRPVQDEDLKSAWQDGWESAFDAVKQGWQVCNVKHDLPQALLKNFLSTYPASTRNDNARGCG